MNRVARIERGQPRALVHGNDVVRRAQDSTKVGNRGRVVSERSKGKQLWHARVMVGADSLMQLSAHGVRLARLYEAERLPGYT